MNANSIPLNQLLPVCPISVNGNSTLVVSKAKKTLVLFWFLCLTFYIQSVSKLCWAYLQNIYRIWSFLTILVQNNRLISGLLQWPPIWSYLLILLWALLPSVIFSENVTPSLFRTFQWLPVQSLPSSSVASPISFLTNLPLTPTLGTLTFFKCSRDLSTWRPLCLLFPLPYCPMVSPGLVLTLSLDIKSHFLSETFLFAFLSTISNLLCVLIFLP